MDIKKASMYNVLETGNKGDIPALTNMFKELDAYKLKPKKIDINRNCEITMYIKDLKVQLGKNWATLMICIRMLPNIREHLIWNGLVQMEVIHWKKSRKLQNLKILKQKITKNKNLLLIFFSKNYIILLYVNK